MKKGYFSSDASVMVITTIFVSIQATVTGRLFLQLHSSARHFLCSSFTAPLTKKMKNYIIYKN